MAFYSRQTREAEQKYSATELEALALVETVKHFSYHLYGKIFTVFTDHKPLCQVLSSDRLNGRLPSSRNEASALSALHRIFLVKKTALQVHCPGCNDQERRLRPLPAGISVGLASGYVGNSPTEIAPARETQHRARVSFHQSYIVLFVSTHSGTGFGIKTKPFPGVGQK